jgi:tetratricopeptide repeat protein
LALDSARNEVDRWRSASLGLGRALTGTREFARAESLLLDAVAARERLLGPSDVRTIEARAALGICYAAEGRRGLAQPILVTALPVLEGSPAIAAGLVRQSREALDRVRSGAAGTGPWPEPRDGAPR